MSELTTGSVMNLFLEDIVVISNVRQGELPRIDELAASIAAMGQKTSIQVSKLEELIGELEKSIPQCSKEIALLEESCDQSEGVEKQEILASIEKLRGKHVTMSAIHSELLSVDEDEREDKFVLIDGHRRLAAASLAGLESLRAEVVEAQADPADVLLAQLTMGTTGQSLTYFEKAKAYASLIGMGLTRNEISSNLGGISREAIRQSVAIIPIVERAERLADSFDEVNEFLVKLEDGTLRSQYLNKAGSYNDGKMEKDGKNPLSDEDFVDLLDGVVNATNFETFRKDCNEKLGTSSRSPQQTKGPKESGKGKDKPRRRSDKEMQFALDKQISLLAIAKKGVEKGLCSKEDVKAVEMMVEVLQFNFGGAEPSVPESLTEASKKYDEIKKQKKETEAAAKKEANSKKADERKAERKADNERKSNERKKNKELYKATVGITEKAVSSTEKKIANLELKIAKLEEEKPEGFEKKIEGIQSSISISNTVLSKQNAQLKEQKANHIAQTPDWLVEENAAKAAKKAAKAAKKAEETSAE